MVWWTKYDIQEKETLEKVPPRQQLAENTEIYLDHLCALSIQSAPATTRLTGIICTIGPATCNEEIMEQMMETGMSIARINCSYISEEEILDSINKLKKAAENYSKKLGTQYPLAIALDVQGPAIRLGYVEGGLGAEVLLKRGDQIKLSTDKAYFEKGSANVMYIDYDHIQKFVQIGHRIYIDDGLITLLCTNIQGSVLTCLIETGGILGSCKSVNLPGIDNDLPAISEQDKAVILFGIKHGVDMIFASYVHEAATITTIRDLIGRNKLMIVAKIENAKGIKNVDPIINASDGIMIGRGDLGIELPIEKLFIIQKSIIAKCNKAGKPVICANQMLESMLKKARPYRSEVNDVANAILDGADCVMLSAETSRGAFPVESILMMSKICKEAEAAIWHKEYFAELVNKNVPPLEPVHAIAIAAVEAAYACLAAAIIVITTSGRSAALISKYRPNCPIITITRSEHTAKQLNLYRGILPLFYGLNRLDNWIKDVEARISFGISFGKWKSLIKAGDPIVAVHGSQKGSGFTDTLKVFYVTKPSQEGDCGCT